MPTWGSLWFQNSVSVLMEQLIYFHDYLMMVMLLVIVIVSYFLVSSLLGCFYVMGLKGGQELESLWTVVPMFVLFVVAFPSLRLLYLMEESYGVDLVIKVMGFQWYWGYEYSQVNSDMFDSYMLSNSEVMRLLVVDESLVVPFLIKMLLLITSSDVIHSWTVPSFGVKADAVPGRLNQLMVMIKRPGLYYGQCSEICGANHSFMPIMVKVVSSFDYFNNLW